MGKAVFPAVGDPETLLHGCRACELEVPLVMLNICTYFDLAIPFLGMYPKYIPVYIYDVCIYTHTYLRYIFTQVHKGIYTKTLISVLCTEADN